MTSAYSKLAERIRGEIGDLERSLHRVERGWPHVQIVSDDSDAYLDSVALNLHGFYSGLERLFELTARHVDQSVPTGDAWHYDLLYQMARDIKDVRPAVISQSGINALDELRKFRHIVRNVYAVNLIPEKMQGLVTSLPRLWPSLKAELLAFADLLDEFAEVGTQ